MSLVLTARLDGVSYDVYSDGTVDATAMVCSIFSIDPVQLNETEQSIIQRLKDKLEEMSHWSLDEEEVY